AGGEFKRTEGSGLARRQHTTGPDEDAAVVAAMLARDRTPTRPSAKRDLAGVGRPVREGLPAENPMRNIDGGHSRYHSLFRQIARSPEVAGEPFAQRIECLTLRDLKFNHPLGCEHLRILLFSQLLRAAEWAAERLSRGVIAH